MTDLQTPLRVVENHPTMVVTADDHSIECSSADVAAEIVRRCNEFEGLRKALQTIRPFVDLDYKTHDGLRVGEIIDAALKGTSNE